jgi:hypothetical protein
MTFPNFTKSGKPPHYTKNSNLFNLHAHNIFVWDKFHYYPPVLFRSYMSFTSLKFSNQNYVDMHFFIWTFLLCAPTILSCSSKYRKCQTLNHSHLSLRFYKMSPIVCICLLSTIWVVFLNSEAAIREKLDTKKEIISSMLIDADLAAWSKKKFLFHISHIILTKTHTPSYFLKQPRVQVPILRREACPYFVVSFPLAKIESG